MTTQDAKEAAERVEGGEDVRIKAKALNIIERHRCNRSEGDRCDDDLIVANAYLRLLSARQGEDGWAARNEALEEAAKVCELFFRDKHVGAAAVTIRDLIRTLKSPLPVEEGKRSPSLPSGEGGWEVTPTRPTSPAVEKLRELHAKTTPGAWTAEAWLKILQLMLSTDASALAAKGRHHANALAVAALNPPENIRADAAFIAGAHNDLPALLLEHDRLAEEVGRLREALNDIEGKCADAIAGRINYRAGDLQVIARRALGEE